MKAKPIKTPKIVVKSIPIDRLGRRILGYCYKYDNYIELERDQPDRGFLDTLIHELAHAVAPSWSEEKVIQVANIISTAIWKKGYRSKRRKH